MVTLAPVSFPKSEFLHEFSQLHSFAPASVRISRPNATQRNKTLKSIVISSTGNLQKRIAVASLIGTGFALTAITLPSLASELTLIAASSSSSLQLTEPSNALSLPTWTIHVSSVVEWIIAMALVWQYGEKSGYESWKGLSWGMVPLLGGAFCACTWHFFYNSESLEVLVAIQAALTVIGNITMCIAAFRIYKYSQEQPDKL